MSESEQHTTPVPAAPSQHADGAETQSAACADGAQESLAGADETSPASPATAVGPHTSPARADETSPANPDTQTSSPGSDEPQEGQTPPLKSQPRSEDELRTMLGLRPIGARLDPALRRRGWIATLVAGLLAALTRLTGLGNPHEVMFDETYYVKDAYALWHNGYESSWSDGADAALASGDFSHLTHDPSFIVHPQLGKWLIALGAQVTGWDSPTGWRLAVAVAGILTVILLTRLALRLTSSPILALVAGLLCVTDGVALTESRISLLDGLLACLALASVLCLVRDREWTRARLAQRLAGTAPGTPASVLLARPWLLATGLAAGAACSIKWSGAYLLAVEGLTVLTWDACALRAVGAPLWRRGWLGRQAVTDFVYLVPTAFAVYVASWWSWFVHPDAYKHGWAASQRAAGHLPRAWLPDSLNDLLEYHLSMYRFHVGLHSSHPYMSKPEGWLLQWRPTSFYWKGTGEAGSGCGADECVRAITSIGTIPLWWCSILALVMVALVGLARRDWRVWAALAGYAGLYLPWFMYRDRTIFTFYTVAFEPYVVLVVTLWIGMIAGFIRPVPGSRSAAQEEQALERRDIGPLRPAPRGRLARVLGFGTSATRHALPEAWAGTPRWYQRGEGLVTGAVLVAMCVAFAVAWWPIWTGQPVSYPFWHLHMLLPSWI